MATLSLSPVIDVVVEVSPLAVTRRAFDLCLIVGDSTVIPASERMRQYTNTDDMLTDGFLAEDPEYIAALLHFQQVPKPRKILVGRKVSTSIKTFAVNAAGTGYSVGDLLTVDGGTAGILRVTTIGSNGTVTAAVLVDGGEEYATATGSATTVSPSGGTGCTINITAVGEAFVDAIRACRSKNTEWYAVSALDAVKADHLAVAAYIETAVPTSTYFYTTWDGDIPTNTASNIFAQIKALKYSRSFGQYSTQNHYAAVSIMGYAMRANTGIANSAYTLKFKQEPGVVVEPINETYASNIKSVNGNIYVNRGYYYDMLEEGVMANGQFFDEIINLDMLVNDIQLNVMDKLVSSPKVPQTDAGVTQLISGCNSACDAAVTRGFLAPGTWTGEPVLNLNTGDTIPGYVVQAETVASQSQADREARKAPPIYVSIKEAGAIHSVTIGVFVNR
jgi:hypothetical protein